MSLKTELVKSPRPSGVTEYRCVQKNEGGAPVRAEAVFPFEERFDGENLELQFFTSKWSREFTPFRVPARSITLRGREGRSSAGIHPMIFLWDDEGGCALALSIAWPGNWTIELRTEPGGVRVLAGMSMDEGAPVLAPGETFVSPPVLAVFPQEKTLAEAGRAFRRWHREENGISNALSRSLPVEWNHWWAYEDYAVNEQNFLENAKEAAALGFEAMVLDAGWYGETALWCHVRGDWDKVNREKFPHGIRYLSDRVHELGMKFGIWCEIETLGVRSQLLREHPEFAAVRDGKLLEYVCFGNPEARQWAFETLDRMITEWNLDWIKLDFNIDPWSGCNRSDHGHDAEDGLWRHYQGYFSVLDRIREKHPEVILENCGSGGQTIDHGILHHTHCTFLSDNDETKNKLRFYSTAFHFLPPEACLHWSWSHSRVDDKGVGPFPSFHPYDPKYKPYELDFHLRAGMLGWLGFSHPLREYSETLKELFARHIRFYKEVVRAYVREGDVSQPGLAGFAGERDAYAFCYTLPAQDSRLLFLFSLKEGERCPALADVCAEKTYRVFCEDTGETQLLSGASLREGLSADVLRANESRVYRIDPV